MPNIPPAELVVAGNLAVELLNNQVVCPKNLTDSGGGC